MNCQGIFKMDADGSIKYWMYCITVEVLSPGGNFVEAIDLIGVIDQGYVASISNLLLLRAVTVENQGDCRDIKDFNSFVELAGSNLLQAR